MMRILLGFLLWLAFMSACLRAQYTPPSGGGGGSTNPAGSGTEVQYRLNGTTFGAMAGSTWTNATRSLVMIGGSGRPVDLQDSTGMIDLFYVSPDSVNDHGLWALGVIPPDVAGAIGTTPFGPAIQLRAPNGGNTTIATTGAGGVGGDMLLRCGAGGTAPNALVSSTGGKGGNCVTVGGGGGVGATQGGAGGDIQHFAGDGANLNGSGGSVLMGAGGGVGTGLDGSVQVLGGAQGNADILQVQDVNGVILSKFGLDGSYTNLSILFAALGTPAAGTQKYCSDCKVTSGADNTCATGGGGAMAFRIASARNCGSGLSSPRRMCCRMLRFAGWISAPAAIS